jgi:hypothetical protein
MFERLMARGVRRAEAQRARRIAELAKRVADDVPPGVTVETGSEGVALVGRGLRRRMLGDVRLRAVGLLAKGEGR